jgi:hypothetical protein
VSDFFQQLVLVELGKAGLLRSAHVYRELCSRPAERISAGPLERGDRASPGLGAPTPKHSAIAHPQGSCSTRTALVAPRTPTRAP